MKTGQEYLESSSKRALDIAGGTAIAMAALPAAISAGLLASVDTRSLNPFFLQERLGRNGVPFTALKFRTIGKSAMSKAYYGTFDPRATRVGQALRQTGLDELPQICNVLRGSMSLVGMRPMMNTDIDYMELAAPRMFDEWYANYLHNRPGMAGPSQLYRHHYRHGFTKELWRKSAELDLRYVDTASLATDIHILAATPFDVVKANIGVVENLQAQLASTGAAYVPLSD